jgi:molybdenum cofactor cytidylyltransferase
MIAAVILAAGASSRLGRPKALVEHEGTSLLRRAVDAARGGGCEPIVVVLGARRVEVAATLAGLPLRVAVNAAWREGIASSIRAGVRSCGESAGVEAALILTCDQPRLTPQLVRQLLERYDRRAGRIVACAYAGGLGVPALFDRARFGELAALAGDRGAKGLIEGAREHVLEVAWPDGAFDVDRPADLPA